MAVKTSVNTNKTINVKLKETKNSLGIDGEGSGLIEEIEIVVKGGGEGGNLSPEFLIDICFHLKFT